MQYLFMNQIGKKAETTLRVVDPPGNPPPEPSKKRVRFSWNTLAEQCINSAIVAGIAGLSALSASPDASWKTALIAFGITMCTELRKYRKL